MASLPSSQAHLPSQQIVKHGCLEISEMCITCYVFESKRPITKNGWSFSLNTFLHGLWIDDYILSDLKANYSIEHVDYEIIGDLTNEELDSIIRCFANSASVKRRYKRILQG